jgi:hypothetical protein
MEEFQKMCQNIKNMIEGLTTNYIKILINK